MHVHFARMTVCAASLALGTAVSAGPLLYVYVDDDAPPGGDGLSWGTALRHLDIAITLAHGVGSVEEVRVAQGVYRPDEGLANPEGSGLRTTAFALAEGVTIAGGYAGLGAPDPDARDVDLYETIFTGDLAGDDGPGFENNGENSFHVVSAIWVNETAGIDGVTITGGNANGSADLAAGGGIYIRNAAPTIRNCTIIANAASGGGGLYCEISSPIIEDCVFTGNIAGGSGGGGYAQWSTAHVANCTFTANSALSGFGGGLAGNDSDVSACTFTGNSANGSGGGFSGSGVLTGCTFDGNSARNGGGASVGNADVTGCTFTNNVAEDVGGGLRIGSSTLTACTITGNTAGILGGGLYDVAGPLLIVSDTVISGNGAMLGGGIASQADQLVLEGVTIRENTADVGGGVYVVETAASLLDCTIEGHVAVFGGGLYVDEGSASLTSCNVIDNYAWLDGGGTYVLSGAISLSGTSVEGNSSNADGAGLYGLDSTTILDASTLYNNFAGDRGGGIFDSGGALSVSASEITYNTTWHDGGGEGGGGIYSRFGAVAVSRTTLHGNFAFFGGGGLYEHDSVVEISASTISGCNTYDGNGGGIHADGGEVSATNVLFEGNWTHEYLLVGGGLFVNGADVTLIHCTLWDNHGWDEGAAIYSVSAQPLLVGCILRQDYPSVIFDGPGAATTVLYSNVQGGWPGAGNIDADPLFADADQRLGPGSPCIDAADATALPAGVTTDLDGNPRLLDDPCIADTGIPDANGLVPDMGAYEFQGASSPPGDLDGDCLLASGDLLLLLAAWGPCPDCGDCAADLDGDCAIGVTDLLLLLAGWS